jgi:hypothetical protein
VNDAEECERTQREHDGATGVTQTSDLSVVVREKSFHQRLVSQVSAQTGERTPLPTECAAQCILVAVRFRALTLTLRVHANSRFFRLLTRGRYTITDLPLDFRVTQKSGIGEVLACA